ILLPCLDEAATVATCVAKARTYLERAGIEGEVVVADNGSTDGSQALASAAGARVVPVEARGYGSALRGGIDAARGRFVIIGDADESYDFSRLDAFVERLRAGDELVMGNRFKGGIAEGAMPPLHRYLGNPVLSFVGRVLFRSDIGDFHCGLRGFDREAIRRLDLVSPGMEFASEMIVKSELAGLRIGEVPTTLRPDGRSRRPHLRTWRDGWRHLKFLLMMSPRWLLLYPGLLMFCAGTLAQLLILRGPVVIAGVGFDIHTMLYSAGATIIGLQLMIFAILARAVGCVKGVLPPTPAVDRLWRALTLERGIALGAVVLVLGLLLAAFSVKLWAATHLSALDPTQMMRYAIPSVTLTIAGAEILFASFVLSFIDPLARTR
ncbi:MAG TPA: glycosyltransferase family 2 protein, partial [Casimicrobiaceae bacterium]|nr:glycosyltransferase family 2 protein [Casimicrobiaceae bacterium]